MQTVFNNDMTVHVWAQGTQEHGRNSKNSISFNGALLYSYRTAIAILLDNGDSVVSNHSYYVTTTQHQYRARRATRGAVHIIPSVDRIAQYNGAYAASELHRFLVDGAEITDAALRAVLDWANDATPVAKLRRDAAKEIAAKEKAARKAELAEAIRLADAPFGMDPRKASERELKRVAASLRAARKLRDKLSAKRAAALLDKARAVREALQGAQQRDSIRHRNEARRRAVRSARALLANPNKRPDLAALEWARLLDDLGPRFATHREKFRPIATAARAAYETIRAREMADYHARQERQRAERAEREAATRAAWLSGAAVHWRGAKEDGTVYLRVCGDELQTSQGAVVPLEEAIRAFRLVAAIRATGRSFTGKDRMRVGLFGVDHIDADGNMRAGCHRIGWPEIARVAAELGLLERVDA